MEKLSTLGFINKSLKMFEKHYTNELKKDVYNEFLAKHQNRLTFFLSIGHPSIRARVVMVQSTKLTYAFDKLRSEAIKFVRHHNLEAKWLKIDLVNEINSISFHELEKLIAQTRKNYFRYGIAFDRDFRLAFLEQELNGNAILRSYNNGPMQIDERNLNHYVKLASKTLRFPFSKNNYRNKTVYIFKTDSLFIDIDQMELRELYNGKLTNGIRKITSIKDETKHLIEEATYYLVKQLNDEGKFNYGYFSAFAKKINTYNILRHASSLYAMAEGYEVIGDEKIIQSVKRGIDYLIETAIVYKDDCAFVVDYANEQEIKLGSNATAILAMTKYMAVTGKREYLEMAQALARGIIQMKTISGGFVHVLEYPSFEIKDLYRIIYYEGEAIFALLRLYKIDQKYLWLKEVKKSFDYFIKNEYWKYHDHWLSYAANELTTYEPKDKYFLFGLKNCAKRLDFIYHRETTFPTFLELTMAAYQMIHKIKELKKDYLLEHIDENKLVETIDRRAEFQRMGFFYPELAMYKKKPDLIVNSFFIRHHSFRVRIDDVEHYLSGYCQYLLYRIPYLPDSYVDMINDQ